LTIAYDGSDFAGWQVQPGKQTIQGMLQRALRRITGHQVHVVGSGRTDAGVHALGQVASCTLEWRDTAARLGCALNAHLPETIVVRQAIDAVDDFHAIRDAVAKRYRYQLQFGGPRDVFDYRYRWFLRGAVDVEAMRDAAARFVGRHDFVSFQAAGSARKTTTRHVHHCEVIEQAAVVRGVTEREPGRTAAARYLAIEVEADGFLYNMVRILVGTLVQIGRGKHPPTRMDELISARNRDLAGPTAPPHGLFLVRVDYAQGSITPSGTT
jgi:tRNA pseudouridine38-40 synthase